MKPYIKIYLDFFGYLPDEYIPCEVCGKYHRDPIHHIEPRGMGGRAGADGIKNLIGLCLECHILAEKKIITKQQSKNIVERRKK